MTSSWKYAVVGAAFLIGNVSAVSASVPADVRITRETFPNGVRVTAVQTSQPQQAPAPLNGAELQLTKSVDQHFVVVGTEITYTYSVTNIGTAATANVRIDDPDLIAALQSGQLEFVDFEFITLPANYGLAILSLNTSSHLSGFVANLEPGDTFTWSARFKVIAPVGAQIVDQATVQADCATDFSTPCTSPVLDLSDDPDVAGAEDPTVVAVAANAPIMQGPMVLMVVGILLCVAGAGLARRRHRTV